MSTKEPLNPSLSVVGKSIARVDALDKVLGRSQFTADLHRNFPGLLCAKVLRSPHAHARIVNLDTSRAEKLPGVRAAVTGKNCPEKINFRAPRILALDEAIRAGEGVAAIAAESPEIAEEAIRLIQVEYEKLPAVLDVEEAMQPNPPAIVDRRRVRLKFFRGLSPPTWGFPSTRRCGRDRSKAALAWPSAPPFWKNISIGMG